MSKNKGMAVVGENGKLVSVADEAKKLKRVLNLSNNRIAVIVEEQGEVDEELKELRAKKAELTRDINKKIKAKKEQMSGLSTQLLVALGDRSGVVKTIKQLGISMEIKPAKEVPAALAIEAGVVNE